MIKEPIISKELRELMSKNLKDYPYGMVCTGILSVSDPQNTIHTTFGGFQNKNELRDSLLSTTEIEKFSSLCNLFSNQEVINFMNELILLGDKEYENLSYIKKLQELSLIDRKNNRVSITGKGRIFILAIYSLIN